MKNFNKNNKTSRSDGAFQLRNDAMPASHFQATWTNGN